MPVAWVKIKNTIPTLYNSLNVHAIRGKKRSKGSSSDISYGLTQPDINENIRFALNGIATVDKNNKHSFFYDNIEIVLEFQSIMVYIASELKLGTCPYNAVYGHEMKHVEAYHSVLRYYGQQLEKALNSSKIPSKENPISFNGKRKEFDNLCNRYNKEFVDIYKKNFRNKKTLQDIYNSMIINDRYIDTPLEYRRVKNSCPSRMWPY